MIRLFEYVSMTTALIGSVLNNTVLAVVSLMFAFLTLLIEDIKTCIPTEYNVQGYDIMIDGGDTANPNFGKCTKRNNLISCLLCPFKKRNQLPSGCKYTVKN